MPFMGFLKQSTQVDKTVLMVDSTDHITGKTGLAAGITKYLSKNGTAASATMTTAEVDATNVKGVYKLTFTTSHTDTLGELQLHLTATGADPADYWWLVVSYLPGEAALIQADQNVNVNKWLTGTPDALSSGKVPSDVKLWLAAAPAALSASGYLQAMLLRWLTDNAGGTPNALISGRVDASAAAGGVIASGTSDSGSGTTMVDAARTESTTGYWIGFVITFTSGAISGIERLITAFDPATDTITFAPALPGGATVSTETYEIRARAQVDVGLWNSTAVLTVTGRPSVTMSASGAGALGRTTFAAETGLQTVRSGTVAGVGSDYVDLDASSAANDDIYNELLITVHASVIQSRWIVDYIGASKRAMVDRPWTINPSIGNNFEILAIARPQAGIAVTLANAQGIKKNTALAAFTFAMFDSAGAPKTGLTGFTAERSIDGGTFSAIAGSVTEIASGFYKVDLTASELNGEVIALRFASSGAVDTLVSVKTVSP